METIFYLSGGIAVLATVLMILALNPVHGLLYLVVSLLAVAVIFYTLGAPLAAALEVIIYAGAIVVLFIFVVMMLNLGKATVAREHAWLKPTSWIGPGILAAVLFAELVYVLTGRERALSGNAVEAKQVGIFLFGPYLLAVELASILLLAALVGAYHLGRKLPKSREVGHG